MYGDNIYIFLNVTFGLFSFLFGYIIIERLDSKLNNHMDDVVRLLDLNYTTISINKIDIKETLERYNKSLVDLCNKSERENVRLIYKIKEEERRRSIIERRVCILEDIIKELIDKSPR